MPCLALQIAHPTFLDWALPAIEGKQVRMAHVRPAYENVSLHGDVFSQVSVAFAQSCLPTGGALSAHWQLPLPKAACPLLVPFLPIGRCLSVVPLSLRCRVTSEACVHMPGLAYKFDSLVMSLWPFCSLALPSTFCLCCILSCGLISASFRLHCL